MTLAILLRRRDRIVNSASSGLSSTSRISTSFDIRLLLSQSKFQFLARGVLWRSDGEEKRSSLIEHPFRPNPPAMFPNDALHDRQAHSCTLKIASLVQPLKNSK